MDIFKILLGIPTNLLVLKVKPLFFFVVLSLFFCLCVYKKLLRLIQERKSKSLIEWNDNFHKRAFYKSCFLTFIVDLGSDWCTLNVNK